MKIKNIQKNNRKKCFELTLSNGSKVLFPYSKLKNKPTPHDPIVHASIDPELAHEGFTCVYKSGRDSSVLLDEVLEYNKDPDYLRKILLYKLSLQVQKLIETKEISKKEIMRRVGLSPTQFYRLINQSFYGKTIDQMIRLLSALDCTVDVVFKKVA